MERDENLETRLQAIEMDVELVSLDQLDLLAQLESQLRASHHAMQHALRALSEELHQVNACLGREHEYCRTMQENIQKMQRLVKELKAAAADGGSSHPSERETSLSAV